MCLMDFLKILATEIFDIQNIKREFSTKVQSKSRKAGLLIAAISGLWLTASAANPQSLTEHPQAVITEASESYPSTFIGRTFWYRPNSPILRTEFYEFARPIGVASTMYADLVQLIGRFYLDKETSFKVLAADFEKLKIEFEDGRVAYMEAYPLAKHHRRPLIERLYPRGNFADVYPDPLFKIDNSGSFASLDAIIGRKFWYLPNATASNKLNIIGGLDADKEFVLDSYTFNQETIDVKLRLLDNTTRILRLDKSTFINFSGAELPFVYVNKDKYTPTKEYLYPGPPQEVIAAAEAAAAERTAAAAKEKAAAAEQRKRSKKEALEILTKELRSTPRAFEVRGFNLGSDFDQDIAERMGGLTGSEANVKGFPDTRKETNSDGAAFYFYRGILFMVTYEDLQEKVEIRAVMNQLESKFKSKFAAIPPQKTIDGNVETTSSGFRMNIANHGVAEVKVASSRPVSRNICIEDISREMRSNIRLGIRNYFSLTDRVETECQVSVHPTQIVFINKPIEVLVNSRANAERQSNSRHASEERLKTAKEKAKSF
jgi:hypothetical protein